MLQRRSIRPGTVSLATALALVVVLVSIGAAGAQVPAGTLTAVNGTVTLTRGGIASPAKYGAGVQVGDQIATGSDGRVTITLSDNSQLELTESSTLVLTENTLNPNGSRASTKVNLLGGLVRSLVRFTGGTPPNFEVHTPNAVAAARGTTYDTDYQNGVAREGYTTCMEFSDVSVYDGTVEVSNPTNTTAPPVDVHAGEKTVVPCGLAAVPAGAAAAATGATTGTTAGIAAGVGALGAAGAVGGIAATGSSGSTSPPQSPASSSQ